jgi:PAS domain-containing protein
MKTVCAWCAKVLVEDTLADAVITHGICPECLKVLLSDIKLSLREFLDSIELPVLVTDENRAIREVNTAAENALGKSAAVLGGTNVGIAIECLHTGVMGECGADAYCAGCTFRKHIQDTYADGQPRHGEYTQHNVAEASGVTARQFRFSTTKIGELVLLAIEGINDRQSSPAPEPTAPDARG